MKKSENIPLKMLKKARLNKGLTIIDMSQKLNMSKSMYDYIEKGIRRLSFEDAVRIANIFKMTPNDLFYEDYQEFFKGTLI